MKQLLVISTVFLFLSCMKNDKNIYKVQNDQISDTEIYEVINFIIDSSYSECINTTKYLTEDEEFSRTMNRNLERIKELDTIFSKQDIEFIYKQATKVDQFHLNQKLVLRKTVIPSDSLKLLITDKYNSQIYRDNYQKKYGTNKLVSTALPLFSLDRNTVIISTSCGMGFGSSGNIEI
jgi:hypothetical protein